MRRRTAPWVQFRLLDKSSPDRVELHIPGCRHKIPFVHHKRGKSPLPQVTPPALPEVDEPSIPSVCLAKGPSETILGFRHHHPVHRVGHKAVGPYLNPAILILAAFCQPIVIIFHEIAIYCADRGQNENCCTSTPHLGHHSAIIPMYAQ
jgi:hypothetical protein